MVADGVRPVTLTSRPSPSSSASRSPATAAARASEATGRSRVPASAAWPTAEALTAARAASSRWDRSARRRMRRSAPHRSKSSPMLGSLRGRPEAVGESANLWTAQRRKDLFRGSYVSAYRWKQRRSLRGLVTAAGWSAASRPTRSCSPRGRLPAAAGHLMRLDLAYRRRGRQHRRGRRDGDGHRPAARRRGRAPGADGWPAEALGRPVKRPPSTWKTATWGLHVDAQELGARVRRQGAGHPDLLTGPPGVKLFFSRSLIGRPSGSTSIR